MLGHPGEYSIPLHKVSKGSGEMSQLASMALEIVDKNQRLKFLLSAGWLNGLDGFDFARFDLDPIWCQDLAKIFFCTLWHEIEVSLD